MIKTKVQFAAVHQQLSFDFDLNIDMGQSEKTDPIDFSLEKSIIRANKESFVESFLLRSVEEILSPKALTRPEEIKEAVRWLFLDKGPLSFEALANLLDIDFSIIREKVKKRLAIGSKSWVLSEI